MYRDTVTIRQDSSPAGSPVPDYSGEPFMTGVPCKITTIGGDSTYRGRMLEASVSHVVEMQYITGITPTMQLGVTGGIHTGADLNITSPRIVEAKGRARKLEIYVTQQAGR
jgi:hypothetical protein